MQPKTILRAFQAYGIRPDYVDLPQGGYRNKVYTTHYDGGQLANLILYKNEPGILPKIQQANRLSDHLHTKGLPVRHTINKRILMLSSRRSIQYASLYNCLPGTTIAWEAYTKDHLKALGLAMAGVHQNSADLPHKDEPNISNMCAKQIKSMQKYFSDQGVKSAMHEKLRITIASSVLSKLSELVQVTAKGEQLLHMDFVRGNVLFQSAQDSSDAWTVGKVQISGVIDFEKVAYGKTVFDIARTVAFLLVDCKHKTKAQVYKYFLDSGYVKRGRGKGPNPNELDRLIQYYLVYDFYKFLKHSPYKTLRQNLHFRRTVSILLQYKLLEVVWR